MRGCHDNLWNMFMLCCENWQRGERPPLSPGAKVILGDKNPYSSDGGIVEPLCVLCFSQCVCVRERERDCVCVCVSDSHVFIMYAYAMLFSLSLNLARNYCM
ncbi:hypothetical protein ACP275_10G029600 [Erythranthe tilingii]